MYAFGESATSELGKMEGVFNKVKLQGNMAGGSLSGPAANLKSHLVGNILNSNAPTNKPIIQRQQP